MMPLLSTLRSSARFVTAAAIAACGAILMHGTAVADTDELRILLEEDFSEYTVGGQPDIEPLRPSNNSGEEESFPISFQSSGGPVGALVVGQDSEPAPALPGDGNQSLRLYDYSGSAMAYAGMNFVDVSSRNDVRVDFRFQRSASFSRFSDEDGLYVTLGPVGGDPSHDADDNRNFELRLFNDGGYIASGETSSSGNFETGSERGVHDVSLFANAHPEDAVDYEGPQGSVTLPALSVNVYLNGERVVQDRGMRHDQRIGKVAFLTGTTNEMGEIDFVIDGVVASELRREDPQALPFPEFFEDFSEREVGEQPRDLFGTGNNIRPSSNSGQDEEPPMEGSGHVGVVVVDDGSVVPAIDGRSLRLYDYGSDIAFAQYHFLREPTQERPDIRLDFQFRRSAAFARTSDSERTMFSMGAPADGDTLRTNAPKAFEVRIWNDGMIGTGASGTSGEFRYEDEDAEELGVHDVTVYANSGDSTLVYDDLNEDERMLDPYSFTTFVNGELIDENRSFRNGDANTPLGAFAIQTGTGMANENMDLVFDNIRVSQFIGDEGLDIGQPGVPDEIEMSRVALGRSWGDDPMPGTEVEIRARVRDAFGLELANREVDFTVQSGGGSLAVPLTVLTDGDGVARIVYATPGEPETAVIHAQAEEAEATIDVNVAVPGPVTDIEATGGTVSTFSDAFGEFRVHVFTETGSDTFEITSGSGDIEVLVVGGGGGGGGSSNNRWGGAGAGAGGMIQRVLNGETGSFELSVGAGGAGGVGDGTAGEQGGNSAFAELVALGGARARGQNNRYDGGSGSGGAPHSSNPDISPGGRGLQPESASGGFGNDGGAGTEPLGNDRAGGGGGGAGLPGGDAGPSIGGAGGDGRISYITGTGVYYAGGGGGAGRDEGGAGGVGGGGSGTIDGHGEDGAPNTGGGGGASSLGDPHNGGDGGSGIVVVRYKIGEAPDVPVPDPTPAVTAERVPGTNHLRLTWLGREGDTYILQHSEDLEAWEDSGESFQGEGEVLEYILEGIGEDDRRFFRFLID